MQFREMLNDICQVSAIQATTALSKFLQTPVGVYVKPVELTKMKEMTKNEDESTLNFFLPIMGNLAGVSFFLYTQKAALSLCDIMFKKTDGTTHSIKENEISALSEVANIVIGNFLTAFSQSLQMDFLMHKSAIFEHASFTNTFNERMPVMIEKMGDEVIKIAFGFHHVNINGHVVVMFDEENLNSLLKKISIISS